RAHRPGCCLPPAFPLPLCAAIGPVPPHPSVVARQAVDGRRLLPMAINAKAHGVIDGPLGNRHLREIAMTGRALDLCSNMRRVIEPPVRFPKAPVKTLSGEVVV